MTGLEVIAVAYIGSVFGTISTIIIFYIKDSDD